MTPSERDTLAATVRNLWPRVKWGPGEWSVLDEKSAHITIDSAQATAAVRNLKATSDKYPTVANVLGALRRAENTPAVGAASPLPSTKQLPEIERLDGLTSFEWRVIQDPAFRVFAKRNGRLPTEREAWIDSTPQAKAFQEANL